MESAPAKRSDHPALHMAPTSSRQGLRSSSVCGLEIRDTADWKSALRDSSSKQQSRYCDFFAEVDVLNGIQQADAFFHWPLESLPARDQSHAAGALIDHCRYDGIFQVPRAF